MLALVRRYGITACRQAHLRPRTPLNVNRLDADDASRWAALFGRIARILFADVPSP